MAIEHIEYTAEQLRAQQRELAIAAGVASVVEVYRRLDAGEFKGTILESELDMLRFLLKEPPVPVLPRAAE